MMAPILLAFLLAQEATSPSYEHLKPLEWMAGTWTSSGKLESGEEYSDEMVVAWIYNKNFLRTEYKLTVAGKVTWGSSSVLGYDADKKRLVGFLFGANGVISRSESVDSDRKDTWVFESKITGEFPFKEDRITYTRVDDATLITEVEVKKDGAFVKTGKYTHKKTK
jgi:hypothetical protein